MSRDRFYGRDSGPPDAVEGALFDIAERHLAGVIGHRRAEQLRDIDVVMIRHTHEKLPAINNRTWVEWAAGNNRMPHGDRKCDVSSSPLLGCTHGFFFGSWIAIVSPTPRVMAMLNTTRRQQNRPGGYVPECQFNARWATGLWIHEMLHRFDRGHGEENKRRERDTWATLKSDPDYQHFAKMHDDWKFDRFDCAAHAARAKAWNQVT